MKVVVADPKEGKCYQTERDEVKSKALYGLRIGSELDGSLVGLNGYKLIITGGTDKDGFPMRPDVHGAERKSVVISGGSGFKKKKGKGQRKKKTVRGNILSEAIAQVNIKVGEYGSKKMSEIFGKTEEKEEKPEEKKVEGKKVEKKEEIKEEKKPEEAVEKKGEDDISQEKQKKVEKEVKEKVQEEKEDSQKQILVLLVM